MRIHLIKIFRDLPARRVAASALLFVVLLAGAVEAALASQQSERASLLSAAERTWIGPDGSPLPFKNDAEIMEFLRSADVVDMVEIGTGITRPHRVVLEKDGIRMQATFRDVNLKEDRISVGGRFFMHFRDHYMSECAAYAMARLLGLDNVPPAVPRRVRGTDGSLQAWVEGAQRQSDLSRTQERPPNVQQWIRQVWAMNVFDNLIFNDDRNTGNVLLDSNWKLWMIDHTRAFQRNRILRDPDEVTHIERGMWERLRTLDEDLVREALRPFLESPEILAVLARRDLLVEHLEQLIAERGEEAVLYSWE